MSTVTKPPLLDETGQSIATTLGNVSIRSAVVDNCTTQDSSKALSANQGKILNDKIEYGCRRNVGELVFSTVELNDAGLKLADGSYIVRGIYSDFYDMIVAMYNAEDWTAPDTSGYLVQPKDVWQAQKNTNGGVIGKYGYDSANNRVYIPDLRNAFIEGSPSDELSKFMQAGVPNITGTISFENAKVNPITSSGAFYGNGGIRSGNYASVNYDAYYDKNIGIDASRSSSVYSDSVTTVQPTSVKYFIYIVIANSYKPPVQIDIDNMLVEVRDMMYPVGSLYLSIDSTSPASLFGGTWTQISEGYALWTASSGAGNTISAGIPNVTGGLDLRLANNSGYQYSPIVVSDTGALGGKGSWYPVYLTGTLANYTVSQTGYSGINFNAASGAATSGIYGNSSTVQPPAYKIYAWRRTA